MYGFFVVLYNIWIFEFFGLFKMLRKFKVLVLNFFKKVFSECLGRRFDVVWLMFK